MLINCPLIRNAYSTIAQFQYLEPSILLKMTKSQNTKELFNIISKKLDSCPFDLVSQYTPMIQFIEKSHLQGFVDKFQTEKMIAELFSPNYTHTHLIWTNYIITKNCNWSILLRNLESIWYQNVFDYDIQKIFTILKYMTKTIKYQLQETTINDFVKILYKEQQSNLSNQQITQMYQCIQMLLIQNPNLVGNIMIQEINENIQKKMQIIQQQQQILTNIGLYLVYPQFQLKHIQEILNKIKNPLTVGQFKNILEIVKQQILHHKKIDDISQIYDILQKIAPNSQTFSNTFQLQLLNDLISQNKIAEYNMKQLSLQDLLYLLDLNQFHNKDLFAENRMFVSKYIKTSLSRRELFASEFDCVLPITKYLKQESYLQDQKPFYKFLKQYCYMF